MQSENRFFEDLSKIFNGAAGTLAGMGREAEASMRARFREGMAGMDFVSRDEFDAVKAMAAAARDEVEALKARVAAMEPGATMPTPDNYTPSPDEGSSKPAGPGSFAE